MKWSRAGYALAAALLFGASTPAAKFFVHSIEPLMLAGLLYAGSGAGLIVWLVIRQFREKTVVWPKEWKKKEIFYLLGAVASGGIIAPVLLLLGLSRTSAATSSLLLNLEAAFTAALACLVFHEHYGKRLVIGLIFILCGGAILSWSGDMALTANWKGVALIAGACAGWAIDNNLTKYVTSFDAPLIAMIKGVSAGTVNISLALVLGQSWPAMPGLFGTALVGFLGYGLSLVLFILSLRKIGTARTSAYFSTAPFAGAILSVCVLGEPLGGALLGAGLLMAVGVYLHLTESHGHQHTHEAMEHEHMHVHDEHHQHEHSENDPVGEPHSHWHRHYRLTHAHEHDHDDPHHQHSH